MVDHAKPDIHKIAFSLYNKQTEETSLAAEENQQRLDFNLNSQQVEDLKKKFDVSYFVVKEELPLSKYENLIALEKRHGVPHGTVYSNRQRRQSLYPFRQTNFLPSYRRTFLSQSFIAS